MVTVLKLYTMGLTFWYACESNEFRKDRVLIASGLGQISRLLPAVAYQFQYHHASSRLIQYGLLLGVSGKSISYQY
jgi:hypothetical protein